MSSTAITPPRPRSAPERRPVSGGRARRMFKPGRTTLDDRITALWTELVASGTADCPVCAAELSAGRPCGGCGSELS